MKKEELHKQIRDIVEWIMRNTEFSSQIKIAEKLDVHRTTLSAAMNGHERAVTLPFLNRLKETFPNTPYSAYTTYNKRTQTTDELNTTNLTKTNTVPLLPILAYGGSLNQFATSVKDSDCERILSPVEGAELAITVTGESMAPKFPNGSKVFIQKINDSAFIDWGKAYVLDTCNGTVLKILVPGSSDDCVKCLSLNPDEIYAPFEVCKKDIYGVYRILMLFSLQ